MALTNASSPANITEQTDQCGWILHDDDSSGPVPALRILEHILFPLFLSICTFGNVLNILILGREKPKSSRGTYLTAVAVLDILYMWAGVLSYAVNIDFEVNGDIGTDFMILFDASYGAIIFVQETCAIASSWIIVTFSVERFVAIVHPMQTLASANPYRRSLLIVLLILCSTCALTSLRIVDYYWVYANYISVDPRPKIRPQRPAALMTWRLAHSWYLASVQIITFFTILTLNLWILRELVMRNRLGNSNFRSSASTRDVKVPFSMLGACAGIYLVTQASPCASNILYLLEKSCVSRKYSETSKFRDPLDNILMDLYFSVNFLLYCGISTKFRKSTKAIFSKCGKKQPEGSAMRTTSTKTNDTKITGSVKAINNLEYK